MYYMYTTLQKLSEFYGRFYNSFSLTLEVKKDSTTITAIKGNRTIKRQFSQSEIEKHNNIFISWLEGVSL